MGAFLLTLAIFTLLAIVPYCAWMVFALRGMKRRPQAAGRLLARLILAGLVAPAAFVGVGAATAWVLRMLPFAAPRASSDAVLAFANLLAPAAVFALALGGLKHWPRFIIAAGGVALVTLLAPDSGWASWAFVVGFFAICALLHVEIRRVATSGLTQCVHCGYTRAGLPESTRSCPECGKAFVQEEPDEA